jgi:hypothetical protein
MRILLVILLACASCAGEPDSTDQEPLDLGTDTSPDSELRDTTEDAADTDDADTDVAEDDTAPDLPRPMAGERVTLDLGPFLPDSTQSPARVFQATSAADLLAGEVASGQIGDWVFENDTARFVIQADRRAMGPCPYGGTVVDSALRTNDGFLPDVTGETCLLVNAGRTLDPQSFEVIAVGGHQVLAVTGPLQIHDFVAIESQAKDLLQGLELDIPLDPNAPLPVTATVYYILHPDSPALTVVTALRNDSDDPVHLAVGHVIDTGGDVSYFNPLSTRKGFGYQPVSDGLFRADPLPFLGFAGAVSSYAFIPERDELLSQVRAIPTGGSYLTIVGLALVMHRLDDILPVLLANEVAIENWPGLLHLQAGDVDRVVYTHVQGTGSVSSVIDPYYEEHVDGGVLRGELLNGRGEPGTGISVVAVRDGRAWNQARGDQAGHYEMRLPPGVYEVRAHRDAEVITKTAEVRAGEEAVANQQFPVRNGVHITATRPDGTPTPARVVALCTPGPCESQLNSTDRDVDTDPFRDASIAGVAYAGADGEAFLGLAPGEYEVVVSRGMGWSIWPARANIDGGVSVEVTEGRVVAFQAEIAEVVRPPGWISADLHVHGVRSLDSSIGHADRVLGHAAAGVHVLVSTDHDVVTDYGPTVAALGLGDEISTVVGEEVTTANYGHYNGFPIRYDPDSPNGGALDWGGAGGFGKSPADIFEWFRAQPGEQVIQVNHPEASGLITALKADPLRGTSLADPAAFRLAPTEVDPDTGDTGLWTDTFTAFELLNSYKMSRFWERFRWWLQMLGRGFSPTGTAVTDTHRLRRVEPEAPRTWVEVGANKDTPGTFDQEVFAAALNRGAAFGTTGPFVQVSVDAGMGRVAGPGQTVRAEGSVTVRVSVQTPEWMEVDTIDIYTNVAEGLDTEPGVPDSTAIAPSHSVPYPWEEANSEVVAVGTGRHVRRSKTISIPLQIDRDAYIVVLVRAESGDRPSMFPIVYDRGARPFAFTNPVFVDADGGGYDNPPLQP